jgi:hypothetical protein
LGLFLCSILIVNCINGQACVLWKYVVHGPGQPTGCSIWGLASYYFRVRVGAAN